MGFLSSLLGLRPRSMDIPAQLEVWEDDDEMFIPLDELDVTGADNELEGALVGEVLPVLLHGIPILSELVHGITLVSELVDGTQPRPTPQAINDAVRSYRQQTIRARVGEIAGVWVPVARARNNRRAAAVCSTKVSTPMPALLNTPVVERKPTPALRYPTPRPPGFPPRPMGR